MSFVNPTPDDELDANLAALRKTAEHVPPKEYTPDLKELRRLATNAMLDSATPAHERDLVITAQDLDWLLDHVKSSVSATEHDRYKRCLYRANGLLIKMGLEPEKLDYPENSSAKSEPQPIERIDWTEFFIRVQGLRMDVNNFKQGVQQRFTVEDLYQGFKARLEAERAEGSR